MHVKGSESRYLPYSTSEDHEPSQLPARPAPLCSAGGSPRGCVERGPGETADRSRWFET